MSSSSSVVVSRAMAAAQAEAMLLVLQARRAGAAQALASGAISELQTWSEIQLRPLPESQARGGCSVAGAYIAGAVPPVLAVVEATSAGRRAFTALHELGHHLQQTEPDLAQTLVGQPDMGAVLEDAACDSFAARVLLPESLVDACIGAGGPTAGDVVALETRSEASRAAVCVRASERLTSPGHVLLLELDGTVAFAASNRLPPIKPGSDQSGVNVIDRALTGRLSGSGMTRFAYRDGFLGAELFVQVAEMRGYLVAVAVTDHAPWERGFTLPSREIGPQAATRICEHPDCGNEFSAYGAPCARCKAPVCPECNRCNCLPQVTEKTCTKCFTVYPARFFDEGSDICQNCS